MLGYITERDLQQADESFPGIAELFESLPSKPRTFLDLLAIFEHWGDDKKIAADVDLDACRSS
jgi:hypothetical protein